MASNMSKINLFVRSASRGYVTAPAKAACSGQLETSRLQNQTVVTSLGCGPKSLVKVAVAFKAGSRYESPENLGVSHLLRSSAGLSTGHATTFSILRNVQQIGASVATVQDRESLLYILETTCDQLHSGLEYLKFMITKQEFRAWELADNVPRLLAELAIIPPQAKALDLLHRAAFRRGLGNSIFVQPFNVKKIGSETLQHFACSQLVGEKAAVAGCGVHHSVLADFAESLDLPSGDGSNVPPSKFWGGEERAEESQPLVHVALAGEAPGLNHPEEVLAAAVARYALGAGAAVKYGTSSGPLGKLSSESAAVSGLSVAHSDAGLLGFYLAARPSHVKQAIEGAVKALKGGVTEADIERGKAQLQTAILFSAESCEGVVEALAGQSLLSGAPPRSPQDLAGAVAQLSGQHVKEVIQKAASGKKALAVIGNTSYAPHLDEL